MKKSFLILLPQVWNFEFWSLEFVCYLVLVFCDFNLWGQFSKSIIISPAD